MSKSMSREEITEILRQADAGSEDLDRLVWSREYGCNYPLTHYDEDTFYQCRAEGEATASMTTNAQMVFKMLEEVHPKANLEIETRGGNIKVTAKLSDLNFGAPITGKFAGKLPVSQIALALATSVSEMRCKYLKIEQENLAVLGVKERVERADNWPVEETAPGEFRAVHHEEKLATQPYRTADKAQEYAAITHHTDHMMLKHRNRYLSLGLELKDDSPSPY